MKNPGGMLGEILEQGGSIVKQTGKAIVNTPTDLAKAGASQVGATGTNESASGIVNAQAQAQPSEDTTKDFVKDIYASSKPQDQKKVEEHSDKTPEELQKIEQIKQQLQQQHKQTYYYPTFNRPKTQEEEERPAEKVEREKMEELKEEQEKQAKKPDDTALKRAQTRAEAVRGVSE